MAQALVRIGVCCVAALTAALAVGSARERSPLEALAAASPRAFSLAASLQEVSGLAPAGPASVFAHNDETALIHEIDIATGATLRTFALGRPTIAGDFEGVAVSGGFLWLATSGGLIYKAPIAKDGERPRPRVFDAGLAGACEIEGLADDGADGFLLLCKRARLAPIGGRLLIYAWTPGRKAPSKPFLNVRLADLVPKEPSRASFRPSEIVRTGNGDLLIVDSYAAAIIALSRDGAFVDYRKLPKAGRHRQPEGLAVMSDGALVVADEGVGQSAGRLTVYPPK